jgi:hypothetical protein
VVFGATGLLHGSGKITRGARLLDSLGSCAQPYVNGTFTCQVPVGHNRFRNSPRRNFRNIPIPRMGILTRNGSSEWMRVGSVPLAALTRTQGSRWVPPGWELPASPEDRQPRRRRAAAGGTRGTAGAGSPLGGGEAWADRRPPFRLRPRSQEWDRGRFGAPGGAQGAGGASTRQRISTLSGSNRLEPTGIVERLMITSHRLSIVRTLNDRGASRNACAGSAACW